MADEELNNSEIQNKEDLDTKEQNSSSSSNKQALIKKILIVAIALLTIFLILIVILLVNKSQTEVEINDDIISAEQQELLLENDKNTDEESKDFKFDFTKLNPEQLNEQLELLTNKSLEQKTIEELNKVEQDSKNRSNASDIFVDHNDISDAILEKEGIDNLNLLENKIEEENENEPNLEEKNPPIKQKVENEIDEVIESNEKKVSSTISTTKNGLIIVQEEIKDNISTKEETKKSETISFVNVINVAKIKGNLQKSYFDKANNIDNSLLLCRDDRGNIELYFGPFVDDKKQDELLNKLLKSGFKEAYKLEMSKKEFDKRCNY